MSNPTNVVYLVENECSDVLSFSSLHITWKAYDRPSALIAAATLLARGYQAQHFAVSQGSHKAPAWHVQATFH